MQMVLPDDVALRAQKLGYFFLRTYQRLAEMANSVGRKSYHMRPKFHELDHVMASLTQMKLNPMRLDCFGDEDFMGKLKKMGAHVHSGNVMHRLQQRYLFYLWIRWRKAARATAST